MSEGLQVLSSNCYQERWQCPEASLDDQGLTPSKKGDCEYDESLRETLVEQLS